MAVDSLTYPSGHDPKSGMHSSISCVISNFNYQDYVAQAIDSALNQTIGFRQIVVVNDGSTDHSMSVLKRYDGKVTILDIPNSGQTAACLRGFAEVQSDYVYFLDADDFLEPDFIESIAPFLETEPVKLQFQLKTMRSDTGAVYNAFPTYAEGYNAEAMISDNETLGFYRSPPTSGNVFKSDYLRSLDVSKLDPRGAIDSTINLLAPYFGEVISINRPLALRRVHESSFGQWSRPTPALLQKELDIFHRTWREATAIMQWQEPPFKIAKPVYVLDRELMIGALSGRTWLSGPVAQFIGRLSRSREPAKQRLLLAIWALTLLLPSQGMRERAIRARRSPVNRSLLLRKVVALVTGK